LEGTAEVILNLGEKRQTIGVLKKGDVFGHSGFFYSTPNAYSIKAI
jgi:CRP-like cAMP-binding protein